MKRFYTWLFAGFISLLGIVQAIYDIGDTAAALADYMAFFVFILVVASFSIMGALIVIRQDGNKVGWLMMVVAIAFADPFRFLLSFFPTPPINLTVGLWLLLWVQNWFWLLVIVAIFQIVLYFPDGSLPSARWKWINRVALGTLFLAALAPVLKEQIGPITNVWVVDNPTGFLPTSVVNAGSLSWAIGLLILGGGSLASIFFRFRRGSYVEREQIKWLLFAGVVFILAVGIFFFTSPYDATYNPGVIAWQEILLGISAMALPLAIANAILRYRLYDIDIIIRRTLVYSVVTLALIAVYFGSVVLLQQLFAGITEQRSPLAIVISTLFIAALFNPLRRRVQESIDRRFFRRKYDAAQILAQFTQTARDEVDLEKLVQVMQMTVKETMQPETVSIWLLDPEAKRQPNNAS